MVSFRNIFCYQCVIDEGLRLLVENNADKDSLKIYLKYLANEYLDKPVSLTYTDVYRLVKVLLDGKDPYLEVRLLGEKYGRIMYSRVSNTVDHLRKQVGKSVLSRILYLVAATEDPNVYVNELQWDPNRFSRLLHNPVPPGCEAAFLVDDVSPGSQILYVLGNETGLWADRLFIEELMRNRVKVKIVVRLKPLGLLVSYHKLISYMDLSKIEILVIKNNYPLFHPTQKEFFETLAYYDLAIVKWLIDLESFIDYINIVIKRNIPPIIFAFKPKCHILRKLFNSTYGRPVVVSSDYIYSRIS
ncbi:MAG: hypothetical protein J7K21_06290 [Desulfurococcales archaeon]|nr:hypothetical protein [Desulfurococcales archaeon]